MANNLHRKGQLLDNINSLIHDYLEEVEKENAKLGILSAREVEYIRARRKGIAIGYCSDEGNILRYERDLIKRVEEWEAKHGPITT